MEIAKAEMEALQATVVAPKPEAQILSNLELALMGGGMGDIIL